MIGSWWIFFRPGPYAITKAFAQDYMWGIEPRQNNTSMMWVRSADLTGYCTSDPALNAQLATIGEQLKTGEVFVYFEYRSINNGDYLNAGDGCATEKGDVEIYKLLSVNVISVAIHKSG